MVRKFQCSPPDLYSSHLRLSTLIFILSFQVMQFTINLKKVKNLRPCLKRPFVTILTFSLFITPYQKDEQSKPGTILTERCCFFSHQIKSFFSPATFPFHPLFYSSCLRLCLFTLKSVKGLSSGQWKGRKSAECTGFVFLYFFFWVGWDWVHVVRRPLTGLLYQPQVMRVDQSAEWELAG
jgi:hypothetical protein